MPARRPQLQVIVVADDFSTGGSAALARAVTLPAGRGAVLHVLHVVPPHASQERQARALGEAQLAMARRREEIAAAARPDGPSLDTSTSVLCGEPFVEVIRHARGLKADLVVVGSHAGGWPGFGGTTAERIVRKGDVPVLVVRNPPGAAYRNAIAAIDVADTAPRVVELALTLVAAGGSVTVFHSYTVAFEEEIAGGIREIVERNRRETRNERLAACERLVAALEKPRSTELRIVVERGDPRDRILGQVEHARADLLVVGTHARSGIAHALLGSVAESLLRKAPCDVAVTRPARFTFEMP